jgi:hypothetical protein
MSDVLDGRKPLFHVFLALCTLKLNKVKNSAQRNNHILRQVEREKIHFASTNHFDEYICNQYDITKGIKQQKANKHR